MDEAQGSSDTPAVVLDTNVVLDWLVFRDASVTTLTEAVESGRVRWLACPRMRDELARTLRYPSLEPWSPNSEQVLTTFDRWAELRLAPTPHPTHPVCTDPDDQVFIALALTEGARWLVTRDRAVLKLARRALSRGVRIVTPAAWTPE